MSFIESYCLLPQLIQTIQENEKISSLVASSQKSKEIKVRKFENGKTYECQGQLVSILKSKADALENIEAVEEEISLILSKSESYIEYVTVNEKLSEFDPFTRKTVISYQALVKNEATSDLVFIKNNLIETILNTNDGVFAKLEHFEKSEILNPKMSIITSLLEINQSKKMRRALTTKNLLNLTSTIDAGKTKILGLINNGSKGRLRS